MRAPDLSSIPPEQMAQWITIAALLQGAELTGQHPEGEYIVLSLDGEVSPSGDGPLSLVLPLTAHVGDQLIDLGNIDVILDSPTVVTREENAAGHIDYAFTTPDRRFRWRLHDHAAATGAS